MDARNNMETAWGVICRAAKSDDGVVMALVNVLTVPIRLYDGTSGKSRLHFRIKCFRPRPTFF